MYNTLALVLMFGGLIIALAGALMFLFAMHTDSRGMAGLGIFLGVGIAFVGPTLLPKPPANAHTREVVTESIKLASLANGTTSTTTTRGTFLAASSTTTQEPIYQFVRDNKDGSYQLETIDGATRVREDATTGMARIDTTRCEYVNQDVRDKWGASCGDEVTTIHVPKGSILRNYTIDANKQ